MMDIYSVFDNVAEKYGNPFVAISDKVALRDFNVGMSSMNSLIKKDYALVKIGRFDELTGIVVSCDNIVLFGSLTPVDIQDNDESQVDNLKEMLKNE